MVTINNYDEFAAYLGKNLGVSDYVELSQERINLFADATLDHQWIHVDTERAAVESPYKTTIASSSAWRTAISSQQLVRVWHRK